MKIRDELQQYEEDTGSNYRLKTNEEIIDYIVNYGHGEINFHTVDINRLVVESERVAQIIPHLEILQLHHQVPNKENTSEYNRGYAKAMSEVLIKLDKI